MRIRSGSGAAIRRMTSHIEIPKDGRLCKHADCSNIAHKASGLCISHGGGKRCQFPDCTKGAQGKLYCKAHGGGRRCTYEGCGKSAESGAAQFCKRHGGGKKCLFEGGGICHTNVRGGSCFCIVHGGGKMCQFAGCTKSARGRGITEYCVRHGGGKRCLHEGCGKSARASADFCLSHGGGKCSHEGCAKGAKGRTGYCKAHGEVVVPEPDPVEEQKALLKVEEAKAATARSVDAAIEKRNKAQHLMEKADVATYKAAMALRIAEAALISESFGVSGSFLLEQI